MWHRLDIYHVLPINGTVRVEVGKNFSRRDVGNLTTHLNDCRSESIGRYCAFELSLFSLLRVNKTFAACEKIVNWSIIRSCGEYEQ